MPPRAIASQVPTTMSSAVAGAGVVAQQELQHHRRRELRRAAEPALAASYDARSDAAAPSSTSASTRRRGQLPRRGQRGDDPLPGLVHLVPPVPPGLGDRAEQPLEGPPRWGKYVPQKNGSPSGVRKHGHRPAALPGQRLGRLHVDGVDVGPLLAVDLDAARSGVHGRRRLAVLERLVRHDVAPVAGRVADARAARARPAAWPPRTPPSDQGHQSTGLSACCSRYGLVASARRLAMASSCPSARRGHAGPDP